MVGALPVIWGRLGEQVSDPVTTLPSSTIETLRLRDGKIGSEHMLPVHKMTRGQIPDVLKASITSTVNNGHDEINHPAPTELRQGRERLAAL